MRTRTRYFAPPASSSVSEGCQPLYPHEWLIVQLPCRGGSGGGGGIPFSFAHLWLVICSRPDFTYTMGVLSFEILVISTISWEVKFLGTFIGLVFVLAWFYIESTPPLDTLTL